MVAWFPLATDEGVRNQVAGITVALLWLLVVEGLLVGLLPSVGKWLFSGAGRLRARASGRSGCA
ncbi:MAG TPA: hypothetical protein VEP73_09830 [Actinomycetota bacterium]|nr:hypothetical protein [Actinomycetota bacterium]